MTVKKWKRELNHLLEIFEIESTISLSKIKQYFDELGRPFDDRFRQYFLEMSTQRLSTSFDTVLLNGQNEPLIKATPHSSVSKQAANNSNQVKIEPNTSPKSNNKVESFDDEHINSELKVENLIEDFVKREFSAVSETELDRKNVNDDSVEKNDYVKAAESFENFWENLLDQMQLRDNAAKQFKCNDCDFVTKYKYNLTKHRKIHDVQKLMGIFQDPNTGLYKCSDCDLQFINWMNLRCHLTVSHRNNRPAFNCVHCTRRFAHEITKDRHEIRCISRRYECYLCKQYVTCYKNNMQEHMRTHSGAKPLQCPVCHQCFRQKRPLAQHLNSKHMHTSKHEIDDLP